MSTSSLPAIMAHKAYRLREAIKQLEEEIKTNPSRQPALDSFRELLARYISYDRNIDNKT